MFWFNQFHFLHGLDEVSCSHGQFEDAPLKQQPFYPLAADIPLSLNKKTIYHDIMVSFA